MPDITAATKGGPLSAERLAEIKAETKEMWIADKRIVNELLAEVRRLSEENGRLRERIEAAADGLTARSGEFNPQLSMERNRTYSDALAFAAEFVRDPSKFSGEYARSSVGEAGKE